MKIKWLGTASLMVEGGGTKILIDPYLRKLNKKLSPFPMEEAIGADCAIITHPHLDHFGDIGEFLDKGLKKVFVSETGIEIAEKLDVNTDRLEKLGYGDSFTVGDIAVRTFRSKHCLFDSATVLGIVFSPRSYFRLKAVRTLLRGIKDYKIDNSDICALEFRHEGKRIFVLGSAGLDENAVYPEGADLLVFPYQGRARMHRYMQPFLERLKPKAVMADHFDDAFPPFTHKINMKKFLPAVKEKLPSARAFVPEEGKWYEV